ncbi:MAG: NADH:ubiquinone oxidoreductase subunit NDUFA12 [Alphaproteobacteria bacterium]|nr:NADH:ubiquinone oxidoreductase subunit NDUFA12 [Alphaproteobacteria bacterium]
MTIATRVFTWWKGEPVGNDQYGNRYFREKGGERRWVLFAGEPDGSKVPPEWKAWLHKTVATPPGPASAHAQPWEKTHQANPTGSGEAYHPAGSLQGAGKRAAATGDYEAWTPG